MAELADAMDSKSIVRKGVWVQVPLRAQKRFFDSRVDVVGSCDIFIGRLPAGNWPGRSGWHSVDAYCATARACEVI